MKNVTASQEKTNVMLTELLEAMQKLNRANIAVQSATMLTAAEAGKNAVHEICECIGVLGDVTLNLIDKIEAIEAAHAEA